jgi:hypothetical protein
MTRGQTERKTECQDRQKGQKVRTTHEKKDRMVGRQTEKEG